MDMAFDLRMLGEILNKEGVDTSQLYRISAQLKQPPLKYKLSPFKIDINNEEP